VLSVLVQQDLAETAAVDVGGDGVGQRGAGGEAEDVAERGDAPERVA
jgi:hypothetical protein